MEVPKKKTHTTTDKNFIFVTIQQQKAETGNCASVGIAVTATKKLHSEHIQRSICDTQGLQGVTVDQQKDYLWKL
jgi:hypothetical protein